MVQVGRHADEAAAREDLHEYVVEHIREDPVCNVEVEIGIEVKIEPRAEEYIFLKVSCWRHEPFLSLHSYLLYKLYDLGENNSIIF